jgi:hypothetical protein
MAPANARANKGRQQFEVDKTGKLALQRSGFFCKNRSPEFPRVGKDARAALVTVNR